MTTFKDFNDLYVRLVLDNPGLIGGGVIELNITTTSPSLDDENIILNKKYNIELCMLKDGSFMAEEFKILP
jgi:hypothetical protein